MTEFIGKLNTQSTAGEKKLFHLLSTTFGADPQAICYYEPQIGGICPDFVILAPTFGVILIVGVLYDFVTGRREIRFNFKYNIQRGTLNE